MSSMVDQALLQQASQLAVADRVELIGALWDTIDAEGLSVTAEEAALVDARLAEADADPDDARPWKEVRAALRRRAR